MRIQIDNEYDTLEVVLVHRPGREIERLNRDNMTRFLFEDIPYLRRMRDEHDAFVAKMRDNDVEVVYIEDLLGDLLADPDARRNVVERACRHEGVDGGDLINGEVFDNDQLVELLFAGLTVGEYADATGRPIPSDPDEFLLSPIPNAYFTRDPAVVVRDAVISSKMHYAERVRESILTGAVFEQHPEFRDHDIAYGSSESPDEDRPFTIEGGDVIVLAPEAVLVGASERTRSETIEKVAANCFGFGNVKRVYEIPIPTERSFMHLDTVFTVLDRGLVLWYADVMEDLSYIRRYEPGTDGSVAGVRRVEESRTLPEILSDEFGVSVTVVDTGGGSKHFASREQRTDGTNVLAIAPRTVIAYERNERTVSALEAEGVHCICIEGSELVRGLGGPRCMTMPLRRLTRSES